MHLRRLVFRGGTLATAVLLPMVLAFALSGHAEIARGLLLGLLVGLLNGVLLARKLDRVIDGREAWQSLNRTMPRNMMLRFALIFAVGAAASRVPDISLAAFAGGIGISLVVGIVYACWAVWARWKREDGAPVYG